MHSMMKERQGSHWQAAPTSTSHSTSADVRSSQIRESRSPDSPITQNERPSTQSKTEPHLKSLPAKGADAQVHGKTFKDFRFGLNGEQVVRENTSAANYDYRLKYPQDKRYHELDEEARVWWVYLDEAAAFDNDMVGELGDSLDILLVFNLVLTVHASKAGLFSAVLTTFVAQTSQSLSQDYSQLSSSYVSELTALMRAGSNMTALSNVPTTNTSFSPAISDLWVNGLWFTSLSIALTVALFAVLAKQWLRQYMSIITGTPRQRVFIRQFRLDGLIKWRVQTIIGLLPVLLHISLILFLAGLVIFLAPLSTLMTYITGSITAVVVILYFTASVLPLFVVQCSYRTTFTDLLYFAYQLLRGAFIKFLEQRWHENVNTAMDKEEGGHNDSPQHLIHSLKEAERSTACWQSKGDQTFEFNALWWLAESTSSVSAKEIIFRSLGAFTFSMTPKLSTSKARSVLYGFKTYKDLLVHLLSLVSPIVHHKERDLDLDHLENIFRAAMHQIRVGNQESAWSNPHLFKFRTVSLGLSMETPSDFQITLAIVACGFHPKFTYNGVEVSLGPSEALRWLRTNNRQVKLQVPALVWRALMKWAWTNNQHPEKFSKYLTAVSSIEAHLDNSYALNYEYFIWRAGTTAVPRTIDISLDTVTQVWVWDFSRLKSVLFGRRRQEHQTDDRLGNDDANGVNSVLSPV
ncbi:hypothetical protein HHX47_DHR10000127 [Lentinula edodes]|nr:hypothetical protein HHX47_DHR10000127 [Lentinula edodes]